MPIRRCAFYADEAAGYVYPENYTRWFGKGYVPEPYDPNVVVDVDDFTDIIGRNFKQPPEGLGFDNSPVAHMWRTMIWPTKFL